MQKGFLFLQGEAEAPHKQGVSADPLGGFE